MRFLFFVSFVCVLALPCLANPALKLQSFLNSARSGDLRLLAGSLQSYIDYNRDNSAMLSNATALTVRRIRGIYPAVDYAKIIGVSPEVLQNIESGNSTLDSGLLKRIVSSLRNERILNYYKERDAALHSPLAVLTRSLGGNVDVQSFFTTAASVAVSETFLAMFADTYILAIDDNDDSAQAKEVIAAAEASLKREYPSAPHTFTELVIDAAPVMLKLLADSKEVAAYYDRLADELTSSSN